ncbi:Golgi to ER traffic protein 4 homolog [Athalia rosae]|uniref:Golgi to ER traffic protein 4 homolog n=1 Tax=Athalia rosae TaxID=37344 RepID=UPI000625FA2B|nr:Golgi to ER traffic protein 4 homolog [Athalia rosae]
MASRGSLGVLRVLAKLEASIDAGNYYEAHQIYRTLHFRYLGQRKFSELLELLYNGSTLLLQHDQQASGADLGILLVDALVKSESQPSQLYFEKLTNLFSWMSKTAPERETFLIEALRWSVKGTDYKTGHPDFHQRIAQIFWKEKNYVMARQHFLYSTDGSGCAAMLVELHEERGYSSEVDLFIVQAVLQYLCLRNKTTAEEAFNTYTLKHPKINSGPPYFLPLLNFLFFLLKAIETGKLTAFTILCEQYQMSLNRDPLYRQYLEKIGQVFFNVSPPRPRSQGFVGTLLQSLFNGVEEEDSDEEQRNAPTSSHMSQELD